MRRTTTCARPCQPALQRLRRAAALASALAFTTALAAALAAEHPPLLDLVWQVPEMVVADSSMEAETAQGSRATKDLIWARQMSNHVQRPMMGPTYLLCDNKAMTEAVNKDGASQRTRYFERATVLTKYAIMRNLVATTLISTEQMVADIFTKPLDETKFNKFFHALANARWNNRGFKAKVGRLVETLEKTLSGR